MPRGVYVRKNARKGKAGKRRRTGPYQIRSLIHGPKYFTEMINVGVLSAGSSPGGIGGTVTAKLNDLPNIAQYRALFDVGTIVGYQAIIMPEYNTFQMGLPGAIRSVPRITYAVNRDAFNTGTPNTELEVLSEDNSKTKLLSKKIVIRVQGPQPALTQGVVGTVAGAVAIQNSGRKFLNIQDSDALNVAFSGVQYWIQQDNGFGAPDVPVARLYLRVMVCMKEQI